MLVRSWPLPPYRIYYRRRDGFLDVMRVYHQARRPLTK
jgi:plasmid stabilization system protein ParE